MSGGRQIGLFSGTYPDAPGFKRDGTSQEAADSMMARSRTLQGKALSIIQARGIHGATADEVAEMLNETVLAVRPRITELSVLGLIVETDRRRKNISRRNAIVWVAA